MNGSGGAYADTFPAQAAFVIVDISQVVFKSDRLERTFFHTFAAADTGHFTCFAGNAAFIFIYTGNEYPAVFRPFVAQFDNISRTGFYTGPAGYAFIIRHFR